MRAYLFSTSIRVLATTGGVGYFPKGSGTLASALCCALILLAPFSDSALWICAVTSVIGLLIASSAQKILKSKDPSEFVIDEWAGMLITLLFLPVTIKVYLIAFAAFRFFDVIKLWPAGAAERLPGGFGVTTDDIVAGIQANLAVQLYLYLMRLWG